MAKATAKKNVPKSKSGKGNRRGSKNNPLQHGELDELKEEKPPYMIIKATLADDICDYRYEVTDGIGVGDKHNVNGSGIVMDSMLEAFRKLHVHLAAVDQIFKHANIEIDDIEKFNNHEFTDLYRVSGFEIFGSGEGESIKLFGNKFISYIHDRHNITTGKIPLDALSSYPWWSQLKDLSDKVREEVKLYKEGNCTPVEPKEEKKPKFRQISIVEQTDGEDGEGNGEENDNENSGEGSGDGSEQTPPPGKRKPTPKELMDGIETDENGYVDDTDFDGAKV